MGEIYIGPVQLPRFYFRDGDYFADLRLHEFRAVDDPGKRIVFDSDEGRKCCGMAGIITCPQCQIHLIVSGYVRNNGVRCVRCGASLT